MQITVALSAPLTSYSHDPRKSMPEPPTLMVGSGISLVSLVQVCWSKHLIYPVFDVNET